MKEKIVEILVEAGVEHNKLEDTLQKILTQIEIEKGRLLLEITHY